MLSLQKQPLSFHAKSPSIDRHTMAYDDISWFSLTSKEKNAISNNICEMKDPDAQALLISKLIEIKYCRQNDIKDVDKQNECWQFILDKKLVPQDLGDGEEGLRRLMVFVKDEGVFFKAKLPQDFKDLLYKLNNEDRDCVLRKFGNREERELMRLFLVDATGENWATISVLDKPGFCSPVEQKFESLKSEADKLLDKRWLPVIEQRKHDFMLMGGGIKTLVTQMIDVLNRLNFDDYTKTGQQIKEKTGHGSDLRSVGELRKNYKPASSFYYGEAIGPFYDYVDLGTGDNYLDAKAVIAAFSKSII